MRWIEIRFGNTVFQVPEKKMFMVTDILPQEGKASFKRIEPPREFRIPERAMQKRILPPFPWKK